MQIDKWIQSKIHNLPKYWITPCYFWNKDSVKMFINSPWEENIKSYGHWPPDHSHRSAEPRSQLWPRQERQDGESLLRWCLEFIFRGAKNAIGFRCKVENILKVTKQDLFWENKNFE